MRILAITTDPDPHVEMVKAQLPNNLDIVTFNPQDFPFQEEITYEWKNDKLSINTKLFNNEEIVSVWYRKPTLLAPDQLPVSVEYTNITYSAYKQSIQWLYSTMSNKLWVSDYWAIRRASSKPYQMEIANRLGMKVPDTLITTSKENAQEFLSAHQDIVVKPLNIGFITQRGVTKASYATRIDTGNHELDFSGLCVSPTIFQKTKVGLDVRVTVIGTDVYACLINKADTIHSQTDWRVGFYHDALQFIEDKSFPKELSNMCVQMVKHLGLQFGAIDFIFDEGDGHYWFLEINPNGQWGFIETSTQLPLSKSFANLLTRSLNVSI